MHTEINYTDHETETAKRDAALCDIKDWFGPCYATIVDVFLAYGKTEPKAFMQAMSFAGVQGYPVTVFYEHLWPEG